MFRTIMPLQKIHALEPVQVIESLLGRNSLSLREFTDSGYSPCNLLFHIRKYTKKETIPTFGYLVGFFA